MPKLSQSIWAHIAVLVLIGLAALLIKSGLWLDVWNYITHLAENSP